MTASLLDRLRPRRAPPLAHGDRIEVEGRPVRLAVNANARRVSLRLDLARREVVATAPDARRLKDAAAFAQARAPWIAARLDVLPAPHPFRAGARIPVRGAPCRLERAAMRIAPRFVEATPVEPSRLIATGEGEAFARAVTRALRRLAFDRLDRRTGELAARLQVPKPHVAVADARGRWGSCRAAAGAEAARIRYSWRLICAPDDVLDYVVAHECAHLIEANHAPAFWALTTRLHGDVAPARAWLRANGAMLQALGSGA